MITIPRTFLIITAALTLCMSSNIASGSPAGGPKNVLVIMNTKSADSVSVAKYYAANRSIASKFICRIQCPPGEVVPDEVFQKDIRGAIERYLTKTKLNNQIDYIVLTKGIPIRTAKLWGVDSALTCMFLPVTEQSPNPYYGAWRPFSHKEFKIYLVTRLDGLTVADAKALVDRSLRAKPLKGLFLFNSDPGKDGKQGYAFVNTGMRQAAAVLKGKKLRVELYDRNSFVTRAGLMGYYSWGKNASGYTTDALHELRFLPGSIAEMGDSYSAYTFTRKRDVKGDRAYIADLVAQGATGVKGYVEEPYTLALASGDILFDRYTSGRNLAESFYAASRAIHWRDLVLGDPLCAPYAGKSARKK